MALSSMLQLCTYGDGFSTARGSLLDRRALSSNSVDGVRQCAGLHRKMGKWAANPGGVGDGRAADRAHRGYSARWVSSGAGQAGWRQPQIEVHGPAIRCDEDDGGHKVVNRRSRVWDSDGFFFDPWQIASADSNPPEKSLSLTVVRFVLIRSRLKSNISISMAGVELSRLPII
jgi:hypothetical protein